MSKRTLKRVQKNKEQIVSEMQLANDATRRRALVKDIIFPYLVDMNDTIAYSKVFLQAFSGLVEGIFDAQRKTTTIGHITPSLVEKLDSLFRVKDLEQKREYDRYFKLIEKLKDISVQDLSYATQLPRYIDGYLSQKRDKDAISTIPVEEILGK